MQGGATQAMSVHIVEERQRSRCPFQAGTQRAHGGCTTIAALLVVDDVHRHRLLLAPCARRASPMRATPSNSRTAPSPHFSQAFYCGGAAGHVYCVALRRAPRRTVKYVCGTLGRAPCIHARLRLLATKPREKCGLDQFDASNFIRSKSGISKGAI